MPTKEPKQEKPASAAPSKVPAKRSPAKKSPAKKAAGPVDLAQTLTAAAEHLAAKGSATIPGVGKFSIRASKGRKGVRRRVILRVDPTFQTALDRNEAPTGETAQTLLEALGDDKTLRITGLGEFAVTHNEATTGVHPRTRTTVVVPARRTLTFNGTTLKK